MAIVQSVLAPSAGSPLNDAPSAPIHTSVSVVRIAGPQCIVSDSVHTSLIFKLTIEVFLQEGKTVSDRSLAIVVRQMALHCNLAALIQRSLEPGKELYASNWLERLRAIKRLRDRV